MVAGDGFGGEAVAADFILFPEVFEVVAEKIGPASGVGEDEDLFWVHNLFLWGPLPRSGAGAGRI